MVPKHQIVFSYLHTSTIVVSVTTDKEIYPNPGKWEVERATTENGSKEFLMIKYYMM